jgi:hypothetical protein
VLSPRKWTRALTFQNFVCFCLRISVFWLAQCLVSASTIGKWGGGRRGGEGHGKSGGLGLAGLGCTDPRKSADPGTDPGQYDLALPPGLMADARQLVDPRLLALPAMPSMMSVCSSSRFRESDKEKGKKSTASASWMPSTPGVGGWTLPLLNFGFSSTSLLTGLHLLSPSPRAPSGTPLSFFLCSFSFVFPSHSRSLFFLFLSFFFLAAHGLSSPVLLSVCAFR